jgi:hypothetical protein
MPRCLWLIWLGGARSPRRCGACHMNGTIAHALENEPELRSGAAEVMWRLETTRLSPQRHMRSNDRVERPATMTRPRPDAAHDAPRSARTRC